MIASHCEDACKVYKVGCCKNQQCGRTQTRNNNVNIRLSRSKSRKKNIECHYCHKKRHVKKDFYALKNKEKDNIKSKDDGHARQSSCPSFSVEIDEINAKCDERHFGLR